MLSSRTMTRRLILTTPAALALGLLAAACGGAPAAPTAAPATPAAGAKPTTGAAPAATSAPAAAGATPAAATGGAKVKVAISHIGGGSLDWLGEVRSA